MDDDFKKMVVVRLDSIDNNLERHMKRSDALEEQTEELKNQVTPLIDLRTEIKGAVKLIYFMAAVAAIVETARLFIK